MERLLVCVDHSPVSGLVLEQAQRLLEHGGSLVVLHVLPADPEWVGYEVGPQTVRDDVAHDLREARARTQAVVEELRERGLDASVRTIRGSAVETILEESRAIDATMIVLGAHRGGRLHELIAGSVAAQVIRKADRPVLVVPPTGR